jgi:hypothetical protein
MYWHAPHYHRPFKYYSWILKMRYTLIFVLIHLASIGGFQYTSDITYMIPSALAIIYSIFQFVKVCTLVFSPHWDVELGYADHIPYQWKFLHNAIMSLSTYILWSEGYGFFAGMTSLYILAVVSSLIITVLDLNMSGED